MLPFETTSTGSWILSMTANGSGSFSCLWSAVSLEIGMPLICVFREEGQGSIRHGQSHVSVGVKDLHDKEIAKRSERMIDDIE